MSFMKILSGLLLALAISCLPSCVPSLYQYNNESADKDKQHYEIYSLYIDKTFSKKELNELVSVINEWNYALNGYLVLKIEPQFIDHTDAVAMKVLAEKFKQTNEGMVIVGANHDDPLVIEQAQDSDSGVLAYVNNIGDRAHEMMVLRDRIGNKNLHAILLHEFGHAMGAMHVLAPSLMFPNADYRQTHCIDKITMAQVAGYHKLNLKHLNYCATENFP